jgi:TIR domain
MDPNPARVFISYRRDDAAGYAGRLEEDLERRLGRGKVFRDVQDIPPGEDFAATIRKRLADAHTVLVLIGPRWAGGEAQGQRRIDDERDFVRLEVQVALESGAQVVPLLLPGATMPAEDVLPEPLKALARRNALPISDPNWDADIARLVASFVLPPRRPVWPWAAGGAAVVAAVAAAVFTLQLGPAADPGDRLLGHWQAEVRYDWGDRYTERFEFKRHAGVITGTAGFLDYPRAIEKLQFDGTNLRFETHSQETMGDSTRELTHAYAAELRGKPPNDLLAFRLVTTGGFSSHKPIEFEARRSAPGGAAASAPARP